ncbi:S8 family serine peptidase [Nonlabens antarcticus]|uniref:S8 family serine peptidase n=1 Tax=Nonlabens antarcticus TaxID=392714 RepID=UPI001890B6C6|nr:S8 family serine peptidase [Nonlabens antarcticus]
MKTFIISVFVLLFSASLVAQDLNAIVYFKDKPNIDFSISNPSTILTQRALERKRRHKIAVDERDVPVNQQYVNDLKNRFGIDYRTQSKWFNCAHVIGSYQNIQNLKSLSYVKEVVYADPSKSSYVKQENKFSEDISLPVNYGNARNQIEMISLDKLHNQGNTGKGIYIALTDSGFPNVNTNTAFITARAENRILGGYDFVAGDNSIYEDNFHGARVLSILAGQVESTQGTYIGSAPDASYYLFRTEDVRSETPVEMSYWVAAAERADSLGVDVINVSLGYLDFDNEDESLSYKDMDGSSFISRGATIATEKGMLIVTSAGNSGRSSEHPWIAAPADAKGVFAVGAVMINGDKSSFSSIGPTWDNRIRPSVVAQGSDTQLISEFGQLEAGNGTSYSGPIIAGAMACFIQAFPNLSVEELISTIQNSSSQASNPDNLRGYGIPDFGKAFQMISSSQVSIPDDFTYYVKDKKLNLNIPLGRNKTQFQLFNLQGQVLLELKLSETENIDLSIFPNGIYIFRFEDESRGYKIAF